MLLSDEKVLNAEKKTGKQCKICVLYSVVVVFVLN